MRPVRSHSDLPSASGTLGKRMGGLVGGSLADFHIPAHLLTDAVTLRQASSLEHDDGCSEYEEFSSSGSSPLLAFINPKSGDGVSMLLGAQLRIQLGSGQVYDLTQHNPESVLRDVLERVDAHERRGCLAAARVSKGLVVLVAGGDGTLSWMLKTVRVVWRGRPLPPVLPVPLGTGNDMARAMGWGGRVRTKHLASVLERAKTCRPAEVDYWQGCISEPVRDELEMQVVAADARDDDCARPAPLDHPCSSEPGMDPLMAPGSRNCAATSFAFAAVRHQGHKMQARLAWRERGRDTISCCEDWMERRTVHLRCSFVELFVSLRTSFSSIHRCGFRLKQRNPFCC
mmetsp:Transcript_32675/g.61414  ORF Transcript_32675/g.61414 Transcript_32675/m.61414 type:complete len:343 (+) Transcript_32675:460-1488(+)